jgi:glycosyltransferase involved in cell wall biosynthesis
MKIAVVYVTYDGAINSTCGVGVISQYFIKSMPIIAKQMHEQLNIDIDFHVAAVDLLKSAHGYSKRIKTTTLTIVQLLGGELHFIDNGTFGNENYGTKTNWEKASMNAAKIIKTLANEYAQVYVYLIDTPFLNVPAYMPTGTKNVIYLLVPHSDVFSHFPDEIPKERLIWETEAFKAVRTSPYVYLASTSEFLTKTIKKHHAIESKKIIDLQTGLMISDSHFKMANKNEVEGVLKRKKLPLDKPLIFSVGRAVSYKGFEDLIDSFKLLCDDGFDAHLVFIASPFRNSPSNIEILKNKINILGLSGKCTPIYDLDMDLPKYIYQWPNTKIVAQLSSREPFGLVPEEVRMWAREEGPLIVASNLDGFIEQIDDNLDGFLVDPSNHVEVKSVFEKILEMPTEEYSRIKTQGYRRCLKNYDYTKAVLESLKRIVRVL